MANIVDSVLNVEGSSELVDQLIEALPSLIRDDKKTVYCEQSKPEITCEREGTKTVSVSFETKWRAPYDMVMAAVRKYHHRGLDVHLWWHDDDGGLGPDPLFGGYSGELIVIPSCFGEFYTKEMPGSWFSKDQGEVTFLALDRMAEGFEECSIGWVHQRVADAHTALQSLTEAQMRAMVQEAYPDRSIITAKFPQDHEVLSDRVASRVQKLNELIQKTWGPQWFDKNNKKFGEVREEELGGLYEMLLDEAYPEESARMQERAKQEVQRGQQRLESPDDGEDYFAGLVITPRDGQDAAS
jgi:hypothetical protein